jgi:tetratricopeptide (TPR) repeat protein
VRRFDEAITVHRDAAAIYRETDDRHGEGTALTNLGTALHQARRFDEAITAHQGAVTILRETGDRHRGASALNNLGAVLLSARRFDEAISAFQDAATILRETGDQYGERVALKNLEKARAAVTRLLAPQGQQAPNYETDLVLRPEHIKARCMPTLTTARLRRLAIRQRCTRQRRARPGAEKRTG